MILAKREPAVKMLVALTFIAASTPIVPPLVVDREARVALRGQLAAEIKRDIGASADVVSAAVVDLGIKRADR